MPHPIPPTRRIRRRVTAAVTAAVLLAGGCAGVLPESSGGTVTLDFFQFKPEAVATFDRLIAGFEKEHPGIEVEQHHVPEAETALRARLVKDDVPDVMTLNGNGTFGELAAAGVFHDFSGEPAARRVNPGIQQVLDDLGTAEPGESNGLPFASNSGGVLYNKRLFARHGVEAPRTWDELLRAAETFEKAGVTPFYGTLKDAWTALPAFNQLAANLPPDAFWDDRGAGRTSFRKGLPGVAGKLAELYRHTQKSVHSRGYEAGNEAFARGESAMYLQGSYALPAIRAFEPEFAMGSFPLPAGDDPDDTRLVSGVDVALTMGRDPEHPEESLAFLDYLMRPDVVASYAEEQSAVPTLRGTEPTDPVLRQVAPYFDDKRITGYPDHRIPLAVGLEALLQQYLIDRRREPFLRKLDDAYDQVLDRRS